MSITDALHQQEETIPFSVEEKFRLKKLEDKQKEKIFEVAFCGHFSAGKSTILNKLLEAEVLPTSPIPTSANIIRIANGELGLKVRTEEEKEKSWEGEIPWNQVREWGMNGNEISGMTITAPLPFLGEHSAILDTPGVDSTDETHEAVTVEQLYTTDVIVYAMDYNHVQSETNLYFLKQLSTEKKPVYILINQVDKHNENEIPFSVFKQSVKDVFSRWEIDYLDMFFTTMKDPEHRLNEFPRFEKKIKSLLYNSGGLLEGSRSRLEQGFFSAVENRLQEEEQERKDTIISEMEERGFKGSQLEEKEGLVQELGTVRNYEEELEAGFEEEIGRLFKNVTLFPYSTTELARNWIESIQPGFKVGLLFSGKKTKEEQENRLKKLTADLQDKVKTQLLFHLQSYYRNVDRTKLSNVEEFEKAIDELDYEVTPELLTSNVKTGHSSRDYVFTFTGEITTLIIRDLRGKAQNLLNIQLKGMKDYYDRREQELTTKLKEFEELEEYQVKLDELSAHYNEQLKVVREKLGEYPSSRFFTDQLRDTEKKGFPDNSFNGFENIVLPEESVIETDWSEVSEVTSVDFSEEETAKWLGNIKDVLQKNDGRKLLSQERGNLLKRIDRYENQRFIVSLFGAFSAGKSSFANALIGEEVLPVSPNPTTATVNTVEKSTEENKHGTALVYIKSEKALNDEIGKVSGQLDADLNINSLKSWKANIQDYFSSMQRTYAEYLMTIKESLSVSPWKLGESFSVPVSEMQNLVADESKACLIDKVNIFYDCPVTEQGIVLVDTPGVNSIHGRHTNVAFQQMRQSDAIFYLTYYNHAFSKADEYFLQQMGKVNESFGSDKLYFVINASDLAGSPGELNGVRKHVHDQLVRNGIDKPRLYHLSSREGLKAKKKNSEEKTDFSYFEKSFYDHTIIELKQLSQKMIRHELQQLSDKANDSLAFMRSEEKEQKQKHEELKDKVAAERERVGKVSFTDASRDVMQEFDQLVVYLRDRMKYVLNDYYSTAVNVTVLTGDTKKELQVQLKGAINDWKGQGEYFLKQELEATLIRIEEKLKRRTEEWITYQAQEMKQELPYLYCDNEVEIEPVELTEVNNKIAVNAGEYTGYVKSKKDFFENGKVKELKEVLVSAGAEAAAETVMEAAEEIKVRVQGRLQEVEKEVRIRLTNAAENELERFEVMFDKEEEESLEREAEELKKYVV
ncbi:dynamin family protein [Evansella clarkii]|uniref:dynamin family protein n=1 Tax=Evansella clarkii TaxID=79879 RepID=UPI0009980C88|nr:dynamin family protein [Evansella clarkii]